MLYPLTFHPVFKERVWGGRQLETLYQKALPPGVPIGESWEITDRPEGVSIIAHGPLAGKDLHWLMSQDRNGLLGTAKALNGRFPLLIKILDAQEKLSLQVHPPPAMASALGGEPKTEMWYIAKANPGAELFVGLKQGVSENELKSRLADGTVEHCFHRLPVRAGDAMFLPSGRVHAIGAGNLIFEIQQNSDTTYRVFDWNRLGLDGRPRELHLRESLGSIDFNDFEPHLIQSEFQAAGKVRKKCLVQDALFTVNLIELAEGGKSSIHFSVPIILAVIEGEISLADRNQELRLGPGRFSLIPASLGEVEVSAATQACYLEIRTGA